MVRKHLLRVLDEYEMRIKPHERLTLVIYDATCTEATRSGSSDSQLHASCPSDAANNATAAAAAARAEKSFARLLYAKLRTASNFAHVCVLRGEW